MDANSTKHSKVITQYTMTDNGNLDTSIEPIAANSFRELIDAESLSGYSFVLNNGNAVSVQFQVILCRRIVQHRGVFCSSFLEYCSVVI